MSPDHSFTIPSPPGFGPGLIASGLAASNSADVNKIQDYSGELSQEQLREQQLMLLMSRTGLDQAAAEKEVDITDQIEHQRKRILRRDFDQRKKEEDMLAIKKKKKLESQGLFSQDQDAIAKLNPNSDAHPFHIEDNGAVTIIVKPKTERFPREYIMPLSYSLVENPIEIVQSEFNKQVSVNRGVRKELSVETLDHELSESIQRNLKGQSKNIEYPTSGIEKHIRAQKEVVFKDKEGNMVPVP